MRALSEPTRRWLIAASFIGFGQQVFVVLRNPYVLAAGHSDGFVTSVQGIGGATGVVAGALALYAARRLREGTALLLAVAANAIGFAMQIASTSPASLLAGAALAGLGIQGITTTAAPFLARNSTPEDRVAVFAAHALALQAVPGALGALAAGYAEHAAAAATGSALSGHRLALGAGVLALAVAFAPLAAVRNAPSDPTPRHG